MDHFKTHIKRTYPEMMHFLTYADNYAVGYFWKQGFSKEITLDRSIWAGYIKDYEGGTIMQCTMLRKVDYLDKASIIAQQREAILTKIREMSKSHIVYPGLPRFQEGSPLGDTVDPQDIPGLSESMLLHHPLSLSDRRGNRMDTGVNACTVSIFKIISVRWRELASVQREVHLGLRKIISCKDCYRICRATRKHGRFSTR